MEKTKLSIEELKPMTPFQVLDNEIVRERFITMYNKVHGSETGDLFFEQEKYYFQKIIMASQDLSKCCGFSIYGVLLDIANNGLTLENTSRPLLYILPGSANAGTKEKPNWIKKATLNISPYGELDMRIQAGQLLYADRPVVVYQGDTFQPKVNEQGQKVVVYAASVPRVSNEVIGGFMKLTRPDGSFDFFWMLADDIERLKGYSSKKNNGRANALYGKDASSIDTGFLEAKIIKHAFKTFPKLRLGQFSMLQKEEEAQASDYGLDEPVYNQIPISEEQEKEEKEEQVQIPEGCVIIDDNDEDVF